MNEKIEKIEELLEEEDSGLELREMDVDVSDGKKIYSLYGMDESGEDYVVVDCETLEFILDFLEKRKIQRAAIMNHGWIDTQVKMPEQDIDILFLVGDKIYLGYYYRIFDIDNSPIDTFTANNGNNMFDLKDIVYWQPLPKLPNE